MNPGNLPTAMGTSQSGMVVWFLRGKIRAGDGTALPNDTAVQRVCNNRVREQVYADSRGDFTLRPSPVNETVADASTDLSGYNRAAAKESVNGIPQTELAKCELRITASGFRPNTTLLAGLTPSSGTLDVGGVTLDRIVKVDGGPINAAEYKAPNEARAAYQKGMEAERKEKLEDAEKYLEKAVKIYPRYTMAWFQLGTVQLKNKETDEAREAFTRATLLDEKFLPPYLSLAKLAFAEKEWPQVLKLTGHILEEDPMNRAGFTEMIVDSDPLNCSAAYYYNAVANYELGKFPEAEKSAAKAERRAEVRAKYPDVHLLLAELYTKRKNYAGAIAEMRTYLEVLPQAKDANEVRAQVAKLEKMSGAAGREN